MRFCDVLEQRCRSKYDHSDLWIDKRDDVESRNETGNFPARLRYLSDFMAPGGSCQRLRSFLIMLTNDRMPTMGTKTVDGDQAYETFITRDQIWNWQANCQRAVDMLRQKKRMSSDAKVIAAMLQ